MKSSSGLLVEQLPEQDEKEVRSRNANIAAWSIVVLFALACGIFLIWYSHVSHQASVAAANDRIERAVVSATNWINNNLAQGAAIEQQLVAALADKDATELANGKVALARVRQRQAQIREDALLQQAKKKATQTLVDAKNCLSDGEIERAIQQLGDYVRDPHATEKGEAQRLLDEASIATSDTQTLETLISMTAREFELVKSTRVIRDGKITHPVLSNARMNTVNRNLKEASMRREKRRVATENARLAKEQAEYLKSRDTDVRNVCWGDSSETVIQVEEVALEENDGSLSGDVVLYGSKAILNYSFHNNKLVKVLYWIDFGESGNPFELDGPLRQVLIEKYFEGRTDTFGIFSDGIDMAAANRTTIWKLPRHTIELRV